MRKPLLLSLSLLLAGCAGAGHTAGLDTGDIAPGAEKTLTFGAESVDLHCHPHPAMKHRVEIAADAPPTVHVHILDGATEEEFRFEPRTVTLAPGGTVTYHNHGNLTHTATQDGSAH